MTATVRVKPVTRIFQFISAGVGFLFDGKKGKTNATARKHNATVLTASPARPKLNRDGKSGSPTRRFLKMHEMAKIYEPTVPTWPMEMMTLKAMDDPMMMRLSRVVMVRVVMTAFRGMSQPVGTYDNQFCSCFDSSNVRVKATLSQGGLGLWRRQRAGARLSLPG